MSRVFPRKDAMATSISAGKRVKFKQPIVFFFVEMHLLSFDDEVADVLVVAAVVV